MPEDQKPISREEIAEMIETAFENGITKWLDHQKENAPKIVGNIVIGTFVWLFKLVARWIVILLILWFAKELFGGRAQEAADWIVQHS